MCSSVCRALAVLIAVRCILCFKWKNFNFCFRLPLRKPLEWITNICSKSWDLSDNGFLALETISAEKLISQYYFPCIDVAKSDCTLSMLKFICTLAYWNLVENTKSKKNTLLYVDFVCNITSKIRILGDSVYCVSTCRRVKCYLLVLHWHYRLYAHMQ